MAEKAKRQPDIADFFKPRSAVPQKRPSPSKASSQDHNVKRAKSPTPRKPLTPSRSLNGDIRAYKSPSVPGSGSVVSIPFRSPRPIPQLANPTYPSASLFNRISSLPPSSPLTPQIEPSLSPFTPEVDRTERSIIQDGKLVEVRGSDEDSDNDSLPSLSDLLKPEKDTITVRTRSVERREDNAETKRREILEKFTRMRSQSEHKRFKGYRASTYDTRQNIDMNELLNEHFGDQEVNTLFEHARNGAKDDIEPRLGDLNEDNNRDILKSLMRTDSDGEDQTSKLLSAVERTEVFVSNKKYSFFQDGDLAGGDGQSLYTEEYCGHDSTSRWSHRESRSQDVLAGHAFHLAKDSRLPDSLLKWMFYRVAIEKEDVLRNAYVEVLHQASPLWTRLNVSAKDIQMLFELLGARTTALEDGPILEALYAASTSHRRRKPAYLLSALNLLRALIADMDFAALGKLAALIVRLALDSDVMSNGSIATGVEEALSYLINIPSQEARVCVAERLLRDLPVQLREPSLQAELLSHIQPTTRFSARLRICFAHQFLFGGNTLIQWDDPASRISLPRITKYVHSSGFARLVHNASRDSGSITLRATTRLLDIAIADGDRPPLTSARKDRTYFNHQIDDLADAVGDVCASIIDTGASHMRRTEAKEALRALHFRLLYSVRTEPRPVKNAFGVDGDDYRAGERSKAFMTKFFMKQRQAGMSTATAPDSTRSYNDIPPNKHMAPMSSSSTSKTEMSETEVLIRHQLGLSP